MFAVFLVLSFPYSLLHSLLSSFTSLQNIKLRDTYHVISAGDDVESMSKLTGHVTYTLIHFRYVIQILLRIVHYQYSDREIFRHDLIEV